MNKWELAETVDADVVVVGGGGAALRAAYEAAEAGAKTILVTKGRITATGATALGVGALAGFAVPDGLGDPMDSPDVHFEDVMRLAKGCADPALVRILVDEAAGAARDLEQWGIRFMKDPAGKTLVYRGDFASRPRSRKIYGHGRPITSVLKEQIAQAGVRTIEQTTVLRLIQDDAGVGGVLALGADGRPVAVRAGATVLGTGGAGHIFRRSLSPPDITGDGYALGYCAGATLANLEFMQVGFGTVYPTLNTITGWMWGLMPAFLDGAGRPVLEGCLPQGLSADAVMKAKFLHYPFSTIDESMWLEICAKRALDTGRTTEHAGLHLDFRGVDDARLALRSDLAAMWPVTKAWLRKKHVDVDATPIEVGLFSHASNGGMMIGPDGETTVSGLFAAGETATGPYGADRLGGNMMVACQVFGKRAGRRAAEVGRLRQGSFGWDRPLRHAVAAVGHCIRQDGELNVLEVRRRLNETTTRHLLVVRSERGLSDVLDELAALGAEIAEGRVVVESAEDLIELQQTANLLQVSELVARAAALRRESRGGHYREDFPRTDPDWARPILVRRGAAGPLVSAGAFGAGTPPSGKPE